MALELVDQVSSLDAIVVPVSGGGLISGIAIAAKSLRPELVIIAAEPSGILVPFGHNQIWLDAECQAFHKASAHALIT